jgi:hypothetical protein
MEQSTIFQKASPHEKERHPMSKRKRTAKEYLIFLDYVCKNLTLGYFVIRLGWALVAHESIYALALISLVGAIYYLSRRSAWQEIAIGEAIFPADSGRIPDPFKFKDRTGITLSVTTFMLLYLFLGYVAQCILVASFCMLLIACIDLNTRRLINNNIRVAFANPQYAPYAHDTDYATIMKKRGIVEWYLFELPHMWKEAGRIAGCAVAFAIANYAYFTTAHHMTFYTYFVDAFSCALFGTSHGAYQWERYAYLVILGTLILNELVTYKWRTERDRQLADV